MRLMKWTCEDWKIINDTLNEEWDGFCVLAVLELNTIGDFDIIDIELTVEDYEYWYDCCVHEDGEWHFYDTVDFGTKDPKDFNNEAELRIHMKECLKRFVEERGLNIKFVG